MLPVCYVAGASPEALPPISPRPEDLLIAADGGLEKLRAAGLVPGLAVGDFDSLGRIPQELPCEVHPVEKDETDTALAVSVGFRRGYRNFFLCGVSGGRPDHTYANYLLLSQTAERGGRIWMQGEGVSVTALRNGRLSFPADMRGTVSVFAVGGIARGICESGLLYSLTDAELSPRDPVGVSNSFTGAAAEISVRDGCLLIFIEGTPGPERLFSF